MGKTFPLQPVEWPTDGWNLAAALALAGEPLPPHLSEQDLRDKHQAIMKGINALGGWEVRRNFNSAQNPNVFSTYEGQKIRHRYLKIVQRLIVVRRGDKKKGPCAICRKPYEYECPRVWKHEEHCQGCEEPCHRCGQPHQRYGAGSLDLGEHPVHQGHRRSPRQARDDHQFDDGESHGAPRPPRAVWLDANAILAAYNRLSHALGWPNYRSMWMTRGEKLSAAQNRIERLEAELVPARGQVRDTAISSPTLERVEGRPLSLPPSRRRDPARRWV